jgi:hypothetical protein
LSSIIVVFPKIEDAKSIKNLLVRHGFTVAGVCSTGAQALTYVDALSSGIIVCGYRFADMLYSDLKECLPKGFEMMLLASQRVQMECRGSDVMYVTMPLKVHDLIDTMNMMEQTLTRRRKKSRLKPKERPPEEQAIIDKAKQVLMERNNMTEDEAHRYIQKTSMDSGNSMVETAEMVLSIMQI